MMDRQAYLEQIDRVNREGRYHPDWDSLAEHPMPSWYPDLKFGIFIHWGVYTVPQFDNEWYSRRLGRNRCAFSALWCFGCHVLYRFRLFACTFSILSYCECDLWLSKKWAI